MKKFIVSLMLATLVTGPAAFAHGVQQQPSLLNALVTVGNHGSLANVTANVGSSHTLADVNANLLGGAVKADVGVGASSSHAQPSYHDQPSTHAPATASVADVRADVLNVVKADVNVGQQTRHGDTLLNLNASVLSGGVGGHDRW